MMSQEQLIAELRRNGYEIPERRLRDWRRKGLLPPLDRRSRGRGLGIARFWKDSQRILTRAMTVYELLNRNRPAKWALLWLWFAGFEVNPETVRSLWLESLARTKKEWLGNALSKEECEDALGDLSHRHAKGFHQATWARELNLQSEQFEPLVCETLNVCFNPDPDIAVDNEMLEVARRLILRGANPATGSGFSDREDLEKCLAFIRENLSNDAMRNLISVATYEELRIAHNRWCSVLMAIRLLRSKACGSTFSDDLTQIGGQIAIQLGGLCIFGLLLAEKKGKGRWLDFWLKKVRMHIT